MTARVTRPRGFSMLEMMVVVVVFAVLTAAVFGLLNVAQQRYKMESQYMDTFQGARLAMDQMARDIHSAGYPPANMFTAAQAAASPQSVARPFGWSPGYPSVTCTVGTTCSATGGPAAFDLIIESDIDPENNNGLEWVRYRLVGTTLQRGVATKTAGGDPSAATLPMMLAYVDNVMNNATTAQMNSLRIFYPGLFPGNNPVPVFTYQFDPGTPQIPENIRAVTITLIVQAPEPDPKTQQPRLVTLSGFAKRVNPNR